LLRAEEIGIHPSHEDFMMTARHGMVRVVAVISVWSVASDRWTPGGCWILEITSKLIRPTLIRN
jgi:hypothetical protein